MIGRKLLAFALAGALIGVGLASAVGAQTVVGVTRHRDQDRQYQPLQRARLGVRHHRQGHRRLLQEGQRRGRYQRAEDQLHHLDDGYSPPKAVEMVRRLVEQDQVALLFQTLGTPTNTAIHKYMNQQKVPHLFVATGATKWNDPKNFPWTMGFQPNYQTEGRVYASYILKNIPDAKVGILYQNDDYGKDYLKGFEDGLGEARQEAHRAEAELRGDRPDHRLADHQPEERGRQRLLQRHHPEVRRAGDQEGARHRLEAHALPEQRVELAGHRAEARRASRPPRASSPRCT